MDLNMIKYAMPFVPGVTARAMGHIKPTPDPRTPLKPSTPLKPNTPPEPSVAPELKKIQGTYAPNMDDPWQVFPSPLFTGVPEAGVPPFYTGVGDYLRSMHIPVPVGVPYRIVKGDVLSYTNSLNRSKLFSERLSPIHYNTADIVSGDIAPDSTIYLMDGKDAMNWLWERRGLKLTDEMWDRIRAARQDVTSQLGGLPQSIYSVWSNDENVNAYSLAFEGDRNKNNLYFNVYNPDYFDQPYKRSTYSGRTLYDNGTVFTPELRYRNYLDTEDHELSHSANPTINKIDSYDSLLITDENGNRVEKDHMFFRKTNDSENPYYDDATTSLRVKDYSDLFAGTYLNKPSEYIGAMARAKRYGAELGFDTTSADPAKARAAMVKTLHYLANHQNPKELSYELQRLNSWLNTAAGNSMKLKLKNNQKYKTTLDYIKDELSPFYTDALNFMTDSTIQGLVRNDTPTNLNNAYLA